MMENHSFDNYFGMLQPWRRARTLGPNGLPSNTNPTWKGGGGQVTAYHAGSPCTAHYNIGQDWVRSHLAWDHGRNDGFLAETDNTDALSYFDGSDIPFYYSLGRTFPICDRYFCSLMGQTDPNRKFMIAGTANGQVNDSSLSRCSDHALPGQPGPMLRPAHATGHLVEGLLRHPADLGRALLRGGQEVPAQPGLHRGVLRRCGGRNAAGRQLRRPRRVAGLGGEPTGHPDRGVFLPAGHPSRDARCGLGQDPPSVHLRRARGLLRPRAPGAHGGARRRGTGGPRRPDLRRPVHLVRVPRPGGRGLTVGQSRLCLTRRVRPHLVPPPH